MPTYPKCSGEGKTDWETVIRSLGPLRSRHLPCPFSCSWRVFRRLVAVRGARARRCPDTAQGQLKSEGQSGRAQLAAGGGQLLIVVEIMSAAEPGPAGPAAQTPDVDLNGAPLQWRLAPTLPRAQCTASNVQHPDPGCIS